MSASPSSAAGGDMLEKGQLIWYLYGKTKTTEKETANSKRWWPVHVTDVHLDAQGQQCKVSIRWLNGDIQTKPVPIFHCLPYFAFRKECEGNNVGKGKPPGQLKLDRSEASTMAESNDDLRKMEEENPNTQSFKYPEKLHPCRTLPHLTFAKSSTSIVSTTDEVKVETTVDDGQPTMLADPSIAHDGEKDGHTTLIDRSTARPDASIEHEGEDEGHTTLLDTTIDVKVEDEPTTNSTPDADMPMVVTPPAVDVDRHDSSMSPPQLTPMNSVDDTVGPPAPKAAKVGRPRGSVDVRRRSSTAGRQPRTVAPVTTSSGGTTRMVPKRNYNSTGIHADQDVGVNDEFDDDDDDDSPAELMLVDPGFDNPTGVPILLTEEERAAGGRAVKAMLAEGNFKGMLTGGADKMEPMLCVGLPKDAHNLLHSLLLATKKLTYHNIEGEEETLTTDETWRIQMDIYRTLFDGSTIERAKMDATAPMSTAMSSAQFGVFWRNVTQIARIDGDDFKEIDTLIVVMQPMLYTWEGENKLTALYSRLVAAVDRSVTPNGQFAIVHCSAAIDQPTVAKIAEMLSTKGIQFAQLHSIERPAIDALKGGRAVFAGSEEVYHRMKPWIDVMQLSCQFMENPTGVVATHMSVLRQVHSQLLSTDLLLLDKLMVLLTAYAHKQYTHEETIIPPPYVADRVDELYAPYSMDSWVGRLKATDGHLLSEYHRSCVQTLIKSVLRPNNHLAGYSVKQFTDRFIPVDN